MSYFKSRPARKISHPKVGHLYLYLLGITLASAVLVSIWSTTNGLTVLLGGLISMVGHAYYHSRSLRYFGSADSTKVISATFNAMMGRWVIVITLMLLAIRFLEEIQAGVLLASFFIVHTAGAFLLTVLVKKSSVQDGKSL